MTPQNEIRGFSKDEIIEMARELGLEHIREDVLEAFAKLLQQKSFLKGYNHCLEDNQAIISLHVDTAVAAEREACAKVCDQNHFAVFAAEAIRARGVQ